MLTTLTPIYLSNDNLIEWSDMTRADTDAAVTNATVTWTLKSADGVTTIASGSASHVSAGTYQGTIESSAITALVDGTQYLLEITSSSGSLNGFRQLECIAQQLRRRVP